MDRFFNNLLLFLMILPLYKSWYKKLWYIINFWYISITETVIPIYNTNIFGISVWRTTLMYQCNSVDKFTENFQLISQHLESTCGTSISTLCIKFYVSWVPAVHLSFALRVFLQVLQFSSLTKMKMIINVSVTKKRSVAKDNVKYQWRYRFLCYRVIALVTCDK